MVSKLLRILILCSFCALLEAEVKAIVFDCDGVLVDSEGIKFQAWQEVLAKKGVVLSPVFYSRFLSGHTGKFILERICTEFSLEFDPKIIEEKNRLYWSLQKQEIKEIAPMVSFLKWAAAQNRWRLGVASSADKEEILFNLQSLAISEELDEIISGKQDLKAYSDVEGVNKPKPYIYLEICKRLEIKPKECLVFEDSEAGVRAAKDAGCVVIAVPTQWTKEQDFSKADRLFLSFDLEDLKGTIQSIQEEGN